MMSVINKPETAATARLKPDLAGIPETMLWTLYDRAIESKRPDRMFSDPEAERIFNSIDYDFEKNYGAPTRLFSVRAMLIDAALKKWLARHPNGLVVSLGEGLETQALRVDNGRMRWLSIDLPEAIRTRELFIAPTQRFRHLAANALDPSWMEDVDPRSGLFIVAQGLFMYLQPSEVQGLFVEIARRFPGADLIFDVVPRAMSELTLAGHRQTPHYVIPSMPWGLDRNEIESTLRQWHPGLKRIDFLPYRHPSRRPALFEKLLDKLSWRRNKLQSLVHVSV
ncbi:class I SAM-dependent methyltransferase [Methylocapsa acidiphila]|uniref:class I SAM-dependent methyltransferase n=1 Tax=Methylocapsa acidiphila TaxID=133552 RepID=UPI00040D512A|nr:class I SAM-dependent methyltransferase [Methylocapsa acidiphila]